MPEEIFYTEEVHEQVALYITKHGGKVQTERVDPAWIFHKVTFVYTAYRRIGEGDNSPVYQYTLADGGTVLIQFLRGRGFVPGHSDHYWTTVHIWEDEMKKQPNEQNLDEATIAVTIHEASLLLNIIYVALLNMHSLDEQQRKMAQRFMVKLQRAALTITINR